MQTAKLIFGIRTRETTSLSVTASGALPAEPPDLRIMTDGQELEISCRDYTWTATLGSGDHIIYLPSPDERWLDAVTFTLDVAATVAIPGPSVCSALVAWTATEGTVRDPKKPLPPPLAESLQSPPLADSTWLRTTLTTLLGELSPARSADQASAAPATEAGVFR